MARRLPASPELQQAIAREFIQHVLNKTGWKPTELARKIDQSPSTITRFINKPDVTHSLSIANLYAISGVSGEPVPPDLLNAYGILPPEQAGAAAEIDLGRRPALGDILVYRSMAEALSHSADNAKERIPRLQSLKNTADVYGLFVRGAEMAPAYEAGDPIIISPHRSPAVGDYAIALTESGDEILGKVDERGPKEISLIQFSPIERITLKLDQIKALHRVYRYAEIIFA